jgi:hypothetical protein
MVTINVRLTSRMPIITMVQLFHEITDCEVKVHFCHHADMTDDIETAWKWRGKVRVVKVVGRARHETWLWKPALGMETCTNHRYRSVLDRPVTLLGDTDGSPSNVLQR